MVNFTVNNKLVSFNVIQKNPLNISFGNREITFKIITTMPARLISDKYIEKSVINAKGDMIVGNEDAEPMRLPIGSPDYFPVVDPTQDRGIKYTNEIDGGTF